MIACRNAARRTAFDLTAVFDDKVVEEAQAHLGKSGFEATVAKGRDADAHFGCVKKSRGFVKEGWRCLSIYDKGVFHHNLFHPFLAVVG